MSALTPEADIADIVSNRRALKMGRLSVGNASRSLAVNVERACTSSVWG